MNIMVNHINLAKNVKIKAKQQIEAARQKAPIPIRHFNFDFKKEALDDKFYFQTVLGSAYWEALSIFLTYGEDLVIETARHHRDLVKDPILKQRLTSLIGQEAIHSKLHNEWNDILKANDFPVKMYQFLADKFFNHIFLKFPQPLKLSMMAAIEHFTAVIAEHMMRNEDSFAHTEDERTIALWMWHMLEESEHKDIAYDVYQQLSGAYGLRIGGFSIALFTILFLVSLGAAGIPLLRHPYKLLSAQGWRDTKYSLSLLFGRKKGVFGSNWHHVFAYLKPSFHPNDYDSSEYLEYYKNYLLHPETGKLSPFFVKEMIPALRQ